MKQFELKKAKEQGRLAHTKGLNPVHCPYKRILSGGRYSDESQLRDAWLNGWSEEVYSEADDFVKSQKPAKYRFKAKLVKDDKRSGFKKGKKFDPRGFYYNQSNQIILVGSVKDKHCGLLAFPVDNVEVEVIR